VVASLEGFCKETGVDPGHLSRAFASRLELSLQSLQRILEALHAALVVQLEEKLASCRGRCPSSTPLANTV